MSTELAVQAYSPLDRAAQLIEKGVSIEMLQGMLELQRQWEADEARKAFHRAFAAFKQEAVTIIKGTEIKDGPLKGKRHADLFDVTNAVIPALSRHEMSHSWKLTKDEPGWIEVTCTVTHVLGYSESASMGGAPDTGPGRNAIQARASTYTYLERYTLLAVTGLAAAKTDDDGAGGPARLTQEEHAAFAEAIEGARDSKGLREAFKVAYHNAQKRKDQASMDSFLAIYEKRKAELA